MNARIPEIEQEIAADTARIEEIEAMMAAPCPLTPDYCLLDSEQ